MADVLFTCGGKASNVNVSYVNCGKCGEEIEVFSDEEKVVCRCGEIIAAR